MGGILIGKPGLIVGIDFGTTNCKVSYLIVENVEMIPNSEGNFVTPSIVYFDKDALDDFDDKTFDQRFKVGEKAKPYLVTRPEKTFYSIKRRISSQEMINIDDVEIHPEFVAAVIFRQLFYDIKKYLEIEKVNAIISVPANYSDTQRQSIKDAVEIAGINVVRLINEPTAAAITYGLNLNEEKKLLIYDFGGGTFDVTVLTIMDGFFDVDTTDGVNKCGGDDIDNLLLELLKEHIQYEYKVDISDNLGVIRTLREECEKAKIRLSDELETKIIIPFIDQDKNGNDISLNYKLKRSEFEKLAIKVIERTKEPIESAIANAGLTFEDIDNVILVGGSSKIPLITQYLSELFPKEKILSNIDPFYAIAMGAALCALAIEGIGEKSKLDIADVSPHSYGIFVINYGGSISKIIHKNDKLPISRTGKSFTNNVAYTTELSFDVYQGEDFYPAEENFLGQLNVVVPQKPKGENKFDVKLSIGENFGILEFQAENLDTQQVYKTKFIAEGSLTSQEKLMYSELLGKDLVYVNIAHKNYSSNHSIPMNRNDTIRDLISRIRKHGIFNEDPRSSGKLAIHHNNTRLGFNTRIRDLLTDLEFDKLDFEIR